jgi:hypothetical protein
MNFDSENFCFIAVCQTKRKTGSLVPIGPLKERETGNESGGLPHGSISGDPCVRCSRR